MKLTYNWLKDFVEIKLPPKQLADKLTMAGLEVTSLQEMGGDFVFEIEITSNRPDWLSVAGIAQEVAAITSKRMKLGTRFSGLGSRAKTEHRKPKTENRNLKITIENNRDCPLYTAKIIRGVKVGPSPEWLKKRLELVGCRSINNIVDITNYVMFSWGEPLHAFDLDKLVREFASSRVRELEINIRRAKNEERIITIDGVERILDDNILVIAAGTREPENPRTREFADRPVAIAGIMGGKESEVSEKTKGILLEAAVFNPLVIRRGRQDLGMQSDSSYRFERGVDLETARDSSWRAVGLIQKIAGGSYLGGESSTEASPQAKDIVLDPAFVQKILGVELSRSKITQILTSLGLEVKIKTKGWIRVTIPSRRQDLGQEIDLVEEICRIYGYANVPNTVPATCAQVIPQGRREAVSGVKSILVGLGLQEAVTLSLVDADLVKNFTGASAGGWIEIANPLSREQAVLRPSLIPGLARAIAANLNQKQEYINIFEIAGIFSDPSLGAREELSLGIALCGIKPLLLVEQGLVKEKIGLRHLKGVIETLLERLGVKNYSFRSGQDIYDFQVCIGQEKVGSLSILKEGALRYLEIKNREVVAAELSLDKVLPLAAGQKRFSALAKYPGIARDISFIIDEKISAQEIYAAIQEKAGPLMRQAKVIDYYQGRQIPVGQRGLTVSCLYRADNRTLTEEEINPLHQEICAWLNQRLGARLR